MRILLVVTGLGVGGAERQVCDLADQFVGLGHTVCISFLTGEPIVRPQDIRVQILPLRVQGVLDGLAGLWRLRELVRGFKPDVVHSHLFHANVACRLLRLFVRIPLLISSAHSTYEGGRIRMATYRATNFLCDRFTNVSERAVASFVSKGAVRDGEMKVHPNGIPLQKFQFSLDARRKVRGEFQLSDHDRLVVAVGRLVPAKDYLTLLDALSLILARSPSCCRALIVGEGPLKERLIHRAATLGISDKVQFVGARRDVPAIMSAADVFVLSSRWEGFGLVVAEAMACERVVIATDCGGVGEVLGPEGYLVSPGSPKELGDAIERVLSLQADQIVAMGISARRRVVRHFSIEEVVNDWLAHYTA